MWKGAIKYIVILIVILAACVFYYSNKTAKESETKVLHSIAEKTMYQSVNKGCLRVDEAITINTEKAEGFLKDYYKEYIADDQKMEYSLYGIAPFLAFSSDSNKIAVIFEATANEKPSTAEYRQYNNEGKNVDDFQCSTN